MTSAGTEKADVGSTGNGSTGNGSLSKDGMSKHTGTTTTRSVEKTGFLYPFIDGEGHDPESLLCDLAASAQMKVRESSALQRSTVAECGELIATVGAQMAERFASGGRMYAFGNGGSSTDAATLAALFAQPITGRPLPALNLAADLAVITALGNDVGFDLVFSRQIIAHSSSRDIAVAMSTSGNSADLMTALSEASRRGLLTIGFAGYDGGQMAVAKEVDHCFVVRSQSIHRIQESQALLGYQLWATVQQHLMPTGAESPQTANTRTASNQRGEQK